MKKILVTLLSLCLVLLMTKPLMADGLFSASVVNVLIDWLGVGVADSQTDGEIAYFKAADDGIAVGAATSINMIIEDDGANWLGFRSPNSSTAGLVFNAGTDADANRFVASYNGSSSQYFWRLDGSDILELLPTVLRADTDDTVDLGTASIEFKDAYIDGTANIDEALFGVASAQFDTSIVHITKADDGISVGGGTSHPSLVIEDDGQQYIQMLNPDNYWQGLRFNEGTTQAGAWLQHYYNGSNGFMQIGLGGAEHTNLFEGGKIALAASAMADSNEQLYIKQADDGITVGNIGERGMIFESSVGGFLQFRSANSASNGLMFNGGTDADNGKFFYIFDGANGNFQWRIDGGQRFQMDVDSFQPTSSGAANLGTSTLPWNQVFLYSPDASVSQCGVDNSDNFTCTGL